MTCHKRAGTFSTLDRICTTGISCLAQVLAGTESSMAQPGVISPGSHLLQYLRHLKQLLLCEGSQSKVVSPRPRPLCSPRSSALCFLCSIAFHGPHLLGFSFCLTFISQFMFLQSFSMIRSKNDLVYRVQLDRVGEELKRCLFFELR